MSEALSAVALGFFDGVHIAHREIIKAAAGYAKENNITAVALTFDRSPMEILSPEKVRYLTNNVQKERYIRILGAQTEFLKTDRALLSMSPDEFITEILLKKYNVKYVVCGYNYRFGKGGMGDTQMLQKAGDRYGFYVHVMEKIEKNGANVSSSHIRELLTNGKIEQANTLLGREFSLSGIVTEGKHLGRRIGFPTANVPLEKTTAVPKRGVYKTRTYIDEMQYSSVTNVGVNPTVGGEPFRMETYIKDFEKDLYGREIEVDFIEFIRPEMKFDSIAQLQERIKQDIEGEFL